MTIEAALKCLFGNNYGSCRGSWDRDKRQQRSGADMFSRTLEGSNQPSAFLLHLLILAKAIWLHGRMRSNHSRILITEL